MYSTLEQNSSRVVISALGQDLMIMGKESIQLPTPNGEIKTIKNICYMLGLSKNLLSIAQIIDFENLVLFTKSMCCFSIHL